MLQDLRGLDLSVFFVGDLSIVVLGGKKLVKMDLISLRGLIDDLAQADDIANPIQARQHEVGMGRVFRTERGFACGCGVLQHNTHCGDVGLEWRADFADLHACIYQCMKINDRHTSIAVET